MAMPYNPAIDWREFHFFKPGEGISKSDLLEIRMCLDYEQGRESANVRHFIASMGASEKGAAVRSVVESRTRFLPIYWQENDEQEKGAEQAALELVVPAVCAAASWFPRPWLSATKASRRAIITNLESVYSPRALPAWPFPMEPDESELLMMTIAHEKSVLLRVVAIDQGQPMTKLLGAFKALLRKSGIAGDDTRRGKIKLASALDDLGCYRLSRLRSSARSDAMV
jgi:hypothetical protein